VPRAGLGPASVTEAGALLADESASITSPWACSVKGQKGLRGARSLPGL
jgi:hypothetical protein